MYKTKSIKTQNKKYSNVKHSTKIERKIKKLQDLNFKFSIKPVRQV